MEERCITAQKQMHRVHVKQQTLPLHVQYTQVNKVYVTTHTPLVSKERITHDGAQRAHEKGGALMG